MSGWDQDFNIWYGGIQPRFGLGLAGSIVGNIMGFHYAERQGLNCGNAEMLGQAALWGGAYGALIPVLAVPWETGNIPGFPWQRKLTQLGPLGGYGAAGYYWEKLAPHNATTGDAIAMYNSTGLSLLSGYATARLLPESWWNSEWGTKALYASGAVVNAAGLVGSHYHRQSWDLDFAQSMFVTLGTAYSATGIGLCAALVIEPVPAPSDRVRLTTTACFGWGGYFLAHHVLSADAEAERTWGFGDAFTMYTGAGLSVLTGYAAYALVPDDMRAPDNAAGRRVAFLTQALVNAGGLAGSYYFLRERDITLSQSALIVTGSALGATMIGGAAALLATPENQTPTTQVTLTTAALGGWGAFFLTHHLVAGNGAGEGQSRFDRLPFRVALSPENVALTWLCAREKIETRLPVLTVQF